MTGSNNNFKTLERHKKIKYLTTQGAVYPREGDSSNDALTEA